MSVKRAVILFNLGGPLRRAGIQPFLFSFFMDRNIIDLPLPFRFLVAQFISRTRARGAADEAYKLLGYKSPLLDNTRAQALALEQKLKNAKVFVCMRHARPRAAEVVKQVKAYRPDEIVLLPLYPQYSKTTTGSAFEDWDRAAQSLKDIPLRRIESYPADPGFIAASADNIKKKLDGAPRKTRLLFSAHGLPEKIIAGGDPYQAQCEQTAAAIVKKLGLPELDWKLCYQSRVGPLKWIGPSTLEELLRAGSDRLGVVIYPLAFVSEHVETLVEIDIEYRHLAQRMRLPYFEKAETAGTHPAFIDGLAALARGG